MVLGFSLSFSNDQQATYCLKLHSSIHKKNNYVVKIRDNVYKIFRIVLLYKRYPIKTY